MRTFHLSCTTLYTFVAILLLEFAFAAGAPTPKAKCLPPIDGYGEMAWGNGKWAVWHRLGSCWWVCRGCNGCRDYWEGTYAQRGGSLVYRLVGHDTASPDFGFEASAPIEYRVRMPAGSRVGHVEGNAFERVVWKPSKPVARHQVNGGSWFMLPPLR